jgi:hypothetical protein
LSDNPHHAALLLIDVVNDLAFKGSDHLLAQALPAARSIRALRAKATRSHVPVVYVNDNFGLWHSERSKILAHCQKPTSRGRKLTRLLAPRRNDYFVIKPMQRERIESSLRLLSAEPSSAKDVITKFVGKLQPAITATAEDEPVKHCLAAYAFESFEIAAYSALIEAARMCGKVEIMELCHQSLAEEIAMAEFLEAQILDVTRLYLSHEQKEQFYTKGKHA